MFTDNTLEIAQEYSQKDSRIRIVNNEVNKKLPLSLNAGFAIAKGEYFTWTSDDNYYSPDALEIMVNTITADTTIDLVYCNYMLIDKTGNVTGKKEFGDINESFMKWEGCGACFLYKKEVHERNKGYDPSTFLIEDYDFFLRAFLHSKFQYLNRADLYFYRIHSESLTGTMSSAVFEIQKIMVEKKMSLLLPKLSENDKMLLYRKYTVYYAVLKNNIYKSSYYLKLLFSKSKFQALATVSYIAVKKITTIFIIIPVLFFKLIKLSVSSNFSNK